jgi:hypothetical protein
MDTKVKPCAVATVSLFCLAYHLQVSTSHPSSQSCWLVTRGQTGQQGLIESLA